MLHPLENIKINYRTVDEIWRLAGDTATDWNFYSKRILLSGVYTSTLLYWLGDKSKNSESSWSFLNNRLTEVSQFGKGLGKIKNFLQPAA
jgi:ubiquinone biosynthesis protein COQ9